MHGLRITADVKGSDRGSGVRENAVDVSVAMERTTDHTKNVHFLHDLLDDHPGRNHGHAPSRPRSLPRRKPTI
jgi:hypothetical protein